MMTRSFVDVKKNCIAFLDSFGAAATNKKRYHNSACRYAEMAIHVSARS